MSVQCSVFRPTAGRYQDEGTPVVYVRADGISLTFHVRDASAEELRAIAATFEAAARDKEPRTYGLFISDEDGDPVRLTTITGQPFRFTGIVAAEQASDTKALELGRDVWYEEVEEPTDG
jgi:hypothetical protein